jgi:anti-sigma regulatory factor (Ser/Thr protein kinase)
MTRSTQPLSSAVRPVPGIDPREELRGLRGTELTCRSREEAEQLADRLAAFLPEPLRHRLGLVELLFNAIEHGNLELGTAFKGRLLREHRLEAEIAARLARAPYRGRQVHVVIARVDPLTEIEIRDDGPGFAWRDALAAEVVASSEPNGRGIALVRHSCFPDLEYRDPGNVALVRLRWPS